MVTFPGHDQFQGSSPLGVVGFLSGFAGVDDGDTTAITAVLAGVLAIAAGLVLAFHLRRRGELLVTDDFAASAAERVDRAYLAGVCFLVVTVGLSAITVVGYAVMRLVAPDVTGEVRQFEQDQGTAQLIAYGLLTLVCIGIFRASFWSIRGGREGDHGFVDDELVEPT